MVLHEPHTWTITHKAGPAETLILPADSCIGIEVELTQKRFFTYEAHILPALLRSYDFVCYFAARDAYHAVVKARRDHLASPEQRKRIRIYQLAQRGEEP